MSKPSIHKDLKKFSRIQKANIKATKGIAPVAIASLFLFVVFFLIGDFSCSTGTSAIIMIAAIVGGYMALNIGANDVANNVGPAVGSKALTMGGALIIAAIFESAGALIAGGNVVSTISKGIIDPKSIADSTVFMMLMLSALLAGALWINIATIFNAPVSTTHSIVGGVMGGGIAAVGMSVVDWSVMGKIAASWVISPVLGGFIAAMLFAFVKNVVLNKEDKLTAAKKWVPILVSIMASAFTMYLMVKGLKKIWKPEKEIIWGVGFAVLVFLPMILKPFIAKAVESLENNKKGVNELFTLPLIVSAALLSFAHGANDVANAVGPLAAIVSSYSEGAIASKVGIPLWVMLIGAVGISIGLILFGPKIIKTVGEKITKLDRVRAYCIALSAAVTVLVASQLGLPVSSTHIAVGGVFGVGLYREISGHKKRQKNIGADLIVKRKLVRRSHLLSIISAWIITVPCTASLAGGIYYLLTNIKFDIIIAQ